MGAGVVGATTAYFLAKDGHQVAVIDRQPGSGLETSFANGGQVSASHAAPWAAPAMPLKALKWMGRADAPLVFKWWRLDPALWSWGVKFLANCTTERTARNTRETVRIALYSRETLKALRAETGITYDSLSGGILHIFRDQGAYEAQCHAAEIMRAAGLRQTIIPRPDIPTMEPALIDAAPSLVGAIHSPADESGDAHLFTRHITDMAIAAGADFHYEESVLGLDMEAGRIAAIQTDKRRLSADRYILSLGSWSPFIARQVGLSLPIYPAKGYSITLPLDGKPPGAPTLSITDDEHKMVYSRLGNRFRAAGTAELTGWNASLNMRRAGLIQRNAEALFPNAGDYSKAVAWTGLRPKTPDSVPYICRTPVDNLILNTGHGTLGWTMAAGSGRIVADILAGRDPEIDISGYALNR